MRRVSPLSHDELVALLSSNALTHPAQLFLRNQLHAETERGAKELAGRFWGVLRATGMELVAFFGRTRVLVVGPGPAEAAVALRKITLTEERGFRILIGPREPAVALLDAIRPKVRVEMARSQPFLCVEDRERLAAGVEMRQATSRDRSWLVRASLRLNEEDLGIPPRTVDERFLARRIQERLDTNSTWIFDVKGRPATKLEIGNRGPAGALLEGVYTEPRYRGAGFAQGLVASASRVLLEDYPRVGLHVGRSNTPAIRAYRGAGFEEVEDLYLVLLTWR